MAARVRREGSELRRQESTPARPQYGRAGDQGATAHYGDPAYYDQAYADRRGDVAYYVRLGTAARGPVLEYGVGTGRIAVELARAGVSVTGVDLSTPMLDRLRARLLGEPRGVQTRIKIVRGDMRTVRLRSRFPLVIAPFNTLQHLYDRADMEQFLARVRAHLAPGGEFVFDVLVPHADYLGADPERTFGAPRFRYPGAGVVRYRERFEYDAIRQVLLMELEFRPESGSAPWTTPLTHRQWFPQELEALLHYNGFGDLRFSGNFTDAAPTHETESLVVRCRRRLARGRGVVNLDSS